MLRSTDTCQNKVSADQYHVNVARAQVNSSSRSSVFLNLTADQVMVFDWIAGLCLEAGLVDARPGLNVNRIIIFFLLCKCFCCFFYAYVDY